MKHIETCARIERCGKVVQECSQYFFKICSGKFRTGQISADDYVKEGSSIMGKKAFVKLIPDLLATLPDGKHKNDLAAANRQL